MKLLITGGAGFIGSNFILYWMKKYPEYLKTPTDQNKENVDKVLDICAKHGVDPFLGGILLNSLV